MPSIRKLEPEEVKVVLNNGKAPSKRAQIAAEYDTYLAQFNPGDFAEVQLDEDEARLTIANRFKSAAKRRNIALRFLRMQGTLMRFEILEPEDSSDGYILEETPEIEEVPVASDAPPTPSRRGRPRRNQA